MSRVINLSNSTECERNDPYFQVRTIIPERYIYEWIEQILVNELNIIPEKGRTYTLSFMDFPQLAEIFGVVGVTGDFDLTFTEEILILEVFFVRRQAYNATLCSFYVARVGSDGGEVVNETGVCGALSYFQTSSVVYTERYSESVSLSDSFTIQRSRGNDVSFFDVLSLNDVFVVSSGRGYSTFSLNDLTLADIFTLSLTTSGNLSFLEAVVAGEVFNVLRTAGFSLPLNDSINMVDLFTASVGRGNNQSYLDSMTVADLFSTATNSGYNLSFSESVAILDLVTLITQGSAGNLSFVEVLFLADQFVNRISMERDLTYSDVILVTEAFTKYIQRYAGSRCQIYVDRVVSDGGQVLDPLGVCSSLGYFTAGQPSTDYVQSYQENLVLAEAFSLIGTGRQYRITFNDVLNVVDSFGNDASYKDRLFFNDNVTVSDLFTTFKQVNLLLNFMDSVNLVDGFGNSMTVSRGNLSLFDSLSVDDRFSVSRTSGLTLAFLDSVQLDDSMTLSTTGIKGFLTFAEGVTVAETNEKFIQRYEGSRCEIYVQRVQADGGQVVNPIGVCAALGYFIAGNPTIGYKLNFQESIAVLTFESVVTGVNKVFTLAFIDSITPQEDFSDRRNKSFTLSFTENVGIASSN